LLIRSVDLTGTGAVYVDTVHRLRHAGIDVSDRRAVKLQRLIAASAVLCGRLYSQTSDLWVLRYIWDAEEQQSVLKSIVDDVIGTAADSDESPHAQAHSGETVNAEQLARDLSHLADRLAADKLRDSDRVFLKDQLGLLAERCQWVPEATQRAQLDSVVADLWKKAEVSDESGVSHHAD
jgi:MoxR-like ATPase